VQDNLNVQDGRNQDVEPHESSSEEIAAQYDALTGTVSAQSGVDERNVSRRAREEEHAKASLEGEEGKKNEAKFSKREPKARRDRQDEDEQKDEPASLQGHEEEREDEAELETVKPKLQRDEQSKERVKEKPAALVKDAAEVGEDDNAPGNRNSNVNIALTEIFESIRSQSLPYSTIRLEDDDADSSCQGKYVYVYDLPPEFNVELAAQCDSLFPTFNLCDYFQDSGIGKPVDTRDNGSQIFVPADRWFNTHQYALELVSHARIKHYKCLTNDSSQASLFYIPFYGGLDVIRWNFVPDQSDIKRHDGLSLKLLNWLRNQPSWTRRNGSDHVMVLGKISWDFRRQVSGIWGSRLLEFPETQQVTKVLIERNPWVRQDIGVPHPTFFHPRSASDIRTWLDHITAQNRTSLVSFVGKERPGTANVRSELVKQCRGSSDCEFVECNHNLCQIPAFVTRAFLRSEFCMQPVGDSPTRRSVFDSLIAGCIPVLFHPVTAYVQYPWHLPRNESSWSVYISEDEVKAGRANVVEFLQRIPSHERDTMRGNIIKNIIPGLLYSAPGSDVRPYKDAFDITIEQLLHRVSHLPALDHVAST
jgi:hypothetical protein